MTAEQHLERLREAASCDAGPLTEACAWAVVELTRLRAENARLRDALKPFAEAAETIYMGDHGEEAYADPDDCRRAAALLAEKEKP